ncbi:patatin-like phospholipase family protein, partial [Stenotrophomonas sp.]
MADKYCDLVMKGGITSGIVYPNAVLALARDYRFKSIGGTSAGAIAAAVAAAAACGDRRQQAGEHLPGDAGYGGLSAVSAQLSRRGFIYSLFQPARGARAAYRLLVVLTGNAGLPRKLLCLAIAVFEIAPL